MRRCSIGRWTHRALTAWLVAPAASAASRGADPFSLFGISAGKNASSLSVPIQVVILLTLMTLLPAAIMAMTPFLRITVVLHFLRQALGTQTTPSNSGSSGAVFVPGHRDHAAGGGRTCITRPGSPWRPRHSDAPAQAMDAASGPLRSFMVRYAREKGHPDCLWEVAHRAPAAQSGGPRL